MVRVGVLTSLAWLLAIATGPASALSQSWKFGVMSDTQWIGNDDGKNPNSVAVGIINQINQEFIRSGVRFVVQVGDLTNNGSKLALDTRATFAQALYNAGIGFFPLRGNHDASQAAALEFQRVFPQTRDGRNNATPADALVTTDDYGPPPSNTGSLFAIGAGFSSPTMPTGLAGLTYSFTYNDTRFVLLDQFTRTDGTGSGSANVNNNNIAEQQPWISSVLADKPASGHVFVFSHKDLICETHSDNRSEAKDGSGHVLTKAVDTGWASAPAGGGFASNVLTLWGMAIALGREETDIYTLSMTYDPKKVSAARAGSGNFALATRDTGGKWILAVAGNHGGGGKFVAGPWHAGYGLGSYGIDPKTQTVWAVVNRGGDFAARDLTTTPRQGK
jgi:hypothetical protein